MSSAGDVNGDGRDDVLIGAPGADGGKGAAYVVFGRTSTSARAFVLRRGRIVASGTARSLRATRRLPAGRYTLVVVSGSGVTKRTVTVARG